LHDRPRTLPGGVSPYLVWAEANARLTNVTAACLHVPNTDDGTPIPQRLRIAELGLVVHTVLARHPELHYYQGFHDVCAVLLNVLEDRALAAALAEQVATRWLRLAMAPTLQPVLAHLGIIWTLVAREDAMLYEFLGRYARLRQCLRAEGQLRRSYATACSGA